MNRLFSFLILVIFLLAGCVSKKALEESPDKEIDREKIKKSLYLWAFKPNVNVRADANGNATKIAQISDGDSVTYLKNSQGWYHVKIADGKKGWIRSDLLGPKNLSAFRYAVAFVDSLKEKAEIDLYFDKNLYHKRIYISFPSELYTSRQEIEERTQNIIQSYQSEVYKGEVTARVLKPGTDEEYFTRQYKGLPNSEPILPIIPFGYIQSVDRSNPNTIHLTYAAPDETSDDKLIATARNISSKFPLTYQSVIVMFTSQSTPGQNCRLWFKEDQFGEEYKLNRCK